MFRTPARFARSLVVLSLALGVFVAPAQAVGVKTWFVSQVGTVVDASAAGSCQAPHFKGSTQAPILAAAQAATTGDTIHICSGTWTFSSDIHLGTATPGNHPSEANISASGDVDDKDLTFIGDGPTSTILDGNNVTRFFEITGTSDVGPKARFESLQMRNGYAAGSPFGGAIRVFQMGALEVSQVVFKNNTAPEHGGAIAALGIFDNGARVVGPILVERSYFEGNQGVDAAAILVSANESAVDTAIIRNSTFYRNKGSREGALTLDKATVSGSTFVDNLSTGDVQQFSTVVVANYLTRFFGNILFDSTGQNRPLCRGALNGDSANNFATDSSCFDSMAATTVTAEDLDLGFLDDRVGLGFFSFSSSSDAKDAWACTPDDANLLDITGSARSAGTSCDAGSWEFSGGFSSAIVNGSLTYAAPVNGVYEVATEPTTTEPLLYKTFSSATPSVCQVDAVTGEMTAVDAGDCTIRLLFYPEDLTVAVTGVDTSLTLDADAFPSIVPLDLNGAWGVAEDPVTGDVYVSSWSSNRVARVKADGTVDNPWQTITTDSVVTSIAIDPNGSAFLMDWWNGYIHKVTGIRSETPTATTQWINTGTNDYWGTAAVLTGTGDSAVLYVAVESYTSSRPARVLKITNLYSGSPVVDQEWGLLRDQNNTWPNSMTKDANGYLWVGSWGTGDVARISMATGEVVNVTAPSSPQDIAVDSDGNVYVALWSGDIARLKAADTTLGTEAELGAAFDWSWATISNNDWQNLAVDGANIYVTSRNLASGARGIAKITTTSDGSAEVTPLWRRVNYSALLGRALVTKDGKLVAAVRNSPNGVVIVDADAQPEGGQGNSGDGNNDAPVSVAVMPVVVPVARPTLIARNTDTQVILTCQPPAFNVTTPSLTYMWAVDGVSVTNSGNSITVDRNSKDRAVTCTIVAAISGGSVSVATDYTVPALGTSTPIQTPTQPTPLTGTPQVGIPAGVVSVAGMAIQSIGSSLSVKVTPVAGATTVRLWFRYVDKSGKVVTGKVADVRVKSSTKAIKTNSRALPKGVSVRLIADYRNASGQLIARSQTVALKK